MPKPTIEGHTKGLGLQAVRILLLAPEGASALMGGPQIHPAGHLVLSAGK